MTLFCLLRYHLPFQESSIDDDPILHLNIQKNIGAFESKRQRKRDKKSVKDLRRKHEVEMKILKEKEREVSEKRF